MHYVKVALEVLGVAGIVIVVLAAAAFVLVLLWLAYEQANGRNPFQ